LKCHSGLQCLILLIIFVADCSENNIDICPDMSVCGCECREDEGEQIDFDWVWVVGWAQGIVFLHVKLLELFFGRKASAAFIVSEKSPRSGSSISQ
uniref:Uncharacterized protein n=1 Tax=Salarias fasciatus TaxID=181472 RepID=A0A672FLT8_SALFA